MTSPPLPLRFRGFARDLDLKDYPIGVSGAHIHASAVHLDDLLDDVEPQSEALVLPGLALSALEGLEEVRQHAGWNGARVGDGQYNDLGMRPVEPNLDGSVRRAVLQCVADEVGRNLRKAFGIPFTGEIAVLLQLDAALRECSFILPHDALNRFCEV